jgi:hypothetical protein
VHASDYPEGHPRGIAIDDIRRSLDERFSVGPPQLAADRTAYDAARL